MRQSASLKAAALAAFAANGVVADSKFSLDTVGKNTPDSYQLDSVTGYAAYRAPSARLDVVVVHNGTRE